MNPFSILMGTVKSGATIYSGYKAKEDANYNASLTEKQGFLDQQKAYSKAGMLSAQGEGFIGNQRLGFASSGVKLDSGSPLAVLNETRRNLQSDIARTQSLGDNAYLTSLNNATALRKKGQSAFLSSLIQGAGDFAGGFI